MSPERFVKGESERTTKIFIGNLAPFRRLAPIELLRDDQFCVSVCFLPCFLYVPPNAWWSFSTGAHSAASPLPAILAIHYRRSQNDRRGTDLRPITAGPQSDSERSHGAGRAGLWRLCRAVGKRQEVSSGNARS
jgi:hypothetical protein